jgi:RNA polymerase sigma factor (sigma-70 family)
MNKVIQHLRRAVLLQDGAGLSDGQLLGCFIEHRDEAAFAAIVRRHGPMVWGVCRRALASHHDAEDAFQATFLVLVRRAAAIVPREMVGNWLYGVARQTALKARAQAGRRQGRERHVTHLPEPEPPQQDPWRDLKPLLDRELSRLPDKYRVTIVLCDLEGKTRKEAARQLGVPDGTLAARLARARVMLAKRLRRHGLPISGGALAAALAQSTASASVPNALVSSTIKAALVFAAGQAAATTLISANVAALTQGLLKTMLLSKLKIATAVLVVVAGAGIGAGGLIYKTQASQAAHTPEAVPTARDQSDQQSATQPADTGKESESRPQDQPKEKPETAKAELTKLQGTWILVGGAYKGKEDPEEDIKKVLEGNSWQKLVIADANFTWGSIIDEEAMKGTLTIDPAARPKALDLTFTRDGKTVTAKCIYQLEGDKLKLSYGEADRPTEFKTKPGADMPRLYVWKRDKK